MERVRSTHQGTFAEGLEHADPHPELIENRLGYAAGQRTIRFIPSSSRFPNPGLAVFAAIRVAQGCDFIDPVRASSRAGRAMTYLTHQHVRSPCGPT